MREAVKANLEAEVSSCMEDMCRDLFKEWLFDLTFEEKEIWLWNASVEMLKIGQRRETKPLASFRR